MYEYLKTYLRFEMLNMKRKPISCFCNQQILYSFPSWHICSPTPNIRNNIYDPLEVFKDFTFYVLLLAGVKNYSLYFVLFFT